MGNGNLMFRTAMLISSENFTFNVMSNLLLLILGFYPLLPPNFILLAHIKMGYVIKLFLVDN